MLQSRDILASILAQALPSKDRPAQAGKVWVNDASWATPAHWVQTRVTQIELLGRKDVPKGVQQRLRISVRGEHAVAVGDMLLFEGEPIGVVGRVANEMPRAADVIVPRNIGDRLGARPGDTIELEIGKAVQRGADVVQARAMGTYSLISKQPLGNYEPGQKVSVTDRLAAGTRVRCKCRRVDQPEVRRPEQPQHPEKTLGGRHTRSHRDPGARRVRKFTGAAKRTDGAGSECDPRRHHARRRSHRQPGIGK